MRISPRYTGVLCEPLRLPQPVFRGILSLHNEEAERWEHLKPQLEVRLVALFAHYQIEFDGSLESWHSLALCLAYDHVGGFTVIERKVGRPRGSGLDPVAIYRRINRYRADAMARNGRRPSVAEAAKRLAKEDGNRSQKTIENLYAEGRRRRLRSLKKARFVGFDGNDDLIIAYQYALGPKDGPRKSQGGSNFLGPLLGVIRETVSETPK